MLFDCNTFGLKIGDLYEILATTCSDFEHIEQNVSNTASMGIRFLEKNVLSISPYPNTKTYKNLKKNSYIAINFVENVYLYALAALKEVNSPIGLVEFPLKYYKYYSISKDLKHNFPYLNNAWLVIFGKAIEEFQISKNNGFGELKITNFNIQLIDFIKQKESFKYFNRAENLALETIILTTRLKIAKENKNKELFNSIHSKIINYMNDIKRFGKNKNALKVLDLINDYIHALIS